MKKYVTLIFLSFTFIFAQPLIPDANKRFVIDDANVLSSSTETSITELLQSEYDSTSNTIVVYTFPTLDGASIEGYANEVYNKWNIGSKENNNGVLFIIAVDDRKMRIEVGYGLEPYLTDLESNSILESDVKPYFKKGDFESGITNGVNGILTAIKGSYEVKVKKYNDNFEPMPIIIIACVIVFFIGFMKGCSSYFIFLIVEASSVMMLYSKSVFFALLGGICVFGAFLVAKLFSRGSGGGGNWSRGWGGSSWGSGGGWGGGFSGGGGGWSGGGFSGGGGSSSSW